MPLFKEGLLGELMNSRKEKKQRDSLLSNPKIKDKLNEAGWEDDALEKMTSETLASAVDLSNKLDATISGQKKAGLESIETEVKSEEEERKAGLLGLRDNFKIMDTSGDNFGIKDRVGETVMGATGDVKYLPSEIEKQQEESKRVSTVQSKIAGEVGSQEGKEAAEKSRNFRRVDSKMSQAMGLLGKVYKRGREGTGGIVKGGSGLQGIALGAVVKSQDIMNINKFYKPYMGHINMAGMAMMRMQFPGRSKELVDLTLTTVPKPTGNPHMDIVQGAESFIDNFNETIVTATDEYGEPKFNEQETIDMKSKYRDTIYGQLVQGMVEGDVMSIGELDDDELQQLIRYRSIVKSLKGGE